DATAKRHLDRALQLDPDHIGANIKLAELLHRAGEHGAALERLDRISQTGDQRPTALALHGIVLLAAGQPAKAEQVFATLTSIQPGNYSAWNNLGNAKRELGKLEEADACYV